VSQPSSAQPKLAGRRWWLLAAAGAFLALAGYLRWRADVVAFDDAFISFRYARNLLAGQGLVYNPGERVEGYTNFLWTLCAAGGMALGLDPLATTRGLGVAAYLCTILLATHAVGREAAGRREYGVLALLAMLVLPPTFPAFAGAGLETPLVGLLVLLVGLGQHLWDRPEARLRWLAGVPPLLAVLTRLDAGLALAASAAVIVAAERRSWAGLRARLLPALAPAGAGLALYLTWKVWYYGDLLPNTYYAKGAYLTSFQAGLEYLFGFLRSCPAAFVLVALTLFGARAAPDARHRGFARFAALAGAAHVVYLAKVGGDFMEYRLLWEYWPLLVAGATIGALALLRRHPVPAVLGLAAALALSRAEVVLESDYEMQSVAEMDGIAQRASEAGSLLGSVLPAATTIATTAAGLGYHAPDLRVVDEWGLTDRVLAHQPVAEIVYRGHVKIARPEHLAARGVNLQIDHPKLTPCSNPRRKNRPQVFIRLGDSDRCLRTFYLMQTKPLTQLFCAHPHRFVLHEVDCAPP
jgi:arabinofuranosyltransferase